MDYSHNKPNTIYQLDELMTQTRRLAAQYRLQTGQILPISNELAKYDAQKILDLLPPPFINQTLKSVDLIHSESKLMFQVKARVVFKIRSSQRVGQLNLSGDWNQTLLVIYDDSYQPDEIYSLEKSAILSLAEGTSKSKRGGISVGKFKILGRLIWSQEIGMVTVLK